MLTSPKILGPLIISLVILNLVFLHTLWRTCISYVGFFGVSLLLSLPMMLIIYKMIGKKNLIKKSERYALASIGGFFIYLIGFSILPFGLNYYCSNDKNVHVSTIDYKLAVTHDIDDETGERTTSHNYKWNHEGTKFSLGIFIKELGTELHYNVYEGLFGIDVIRDVEIR